MLANHLSGGNILLQARFETFPDSCSRNIPSVTHFMLSHLTIGSSDSENSLKFGSQELGDSHIAVGPPESHSALTNLGVAWESEM